MDPWPARLASNREEHLQQQGTEQFLRRNRRTTMPRIELREIARQLAQNLVHHRAHRAQRVIHRNGIFGLQRRPNGCTLLIMGPHRSQPHKGMRRIDPMIRQKHRYTKADGPHFSQAC
jgi:hypothetical protein